CLSVKTPPPARSRYRCVGQSFEPADAGLAACVLAPADLAAVGLAPVGLAPADLAAGELAAGDTPLRLRCGSSTFQPVAASMASLRYRPIGLPSTSGAGTSRIAPVSLHTTW